MIRNSSTRAKYLVSRVRTDHKSLPVYRYRPISPGDSWEELIDPITSEELTVITSDGCLYATTGKLCGIFETQNEAIDCINKLETLREIMES